MARIDLGGDFVFRGIDTPTADNDAASKQYVDSRPGVIAIELFGASTVGNFAAAAATDFSEVRYDGTMFTGTIPTGWSVMPTADTAYVARATPPMTATEEITFVVIPAGATGAPGTPGMDGAAGPEGPFRVDAYFVQQNFAEFTFINYTPSTDILSYQFNIFATPNTTINIQTPANATLAQVRTAITDGFNDPVILGQYSYRAVTHDVPNGFALRIFFDQAVTTPTITRQDLAVRLTQIVVAGGTTLGTPFGTILPLPDAAGRRDSSTAVQDAPTAGPTGAMYNEASNAITSAPTGWSSIFPTDIINDVPDVEIFSSFARYVPASNDATTVLNWSSPFEIDRRGPPGPAGPTGPAGSGSDVIVVDSTTDQDIPAGSFVLLQAGTVEELYYFVDAVADVSTNTNFRRLTEGNTPEVLLLTVNETGGTSFEQLTDTPNALGNPGQVVAASARTFPTFRADWQLGLSTQLGRFSIAPFNNEIRLNLNAVSSDSVNVDADVVAAANTRGAVVIIAEQSTENIIIEGNVIGNVDLHSIDTILIDEPLTTGAITDLTDGTGYTIYIGPRSQTLEFIPGPNIPDYDPAVLTSGGYAPGSSVYVPLSNTTLSPSYRGHTWFVPMAALDAQGLFTSRDTNVITAPGIGPDWTTRSSIQLADEVPFPNNPPFVTLSDIIGDTVTTPANPGDPVDTDSTRRINGGDGFPGTVVESGDGIVYVYRPGGDGGAAGIDGEGWYYYSGATVNEFDGLNRTADGELSIDQLEVQLAYNYQISKPEGAIVNLTGANGQEYLFRAVNPDGVPAGTAPGEALATAVTWSDTERFAPRELARVGNNLYAVNANHTIGPITTSPAVGDTEDNNDNWIQLTLGNAADFVPHFLAPDPTVTRYPAGLQNSNVITQGTAFPTDNLALNQLFILTEAITGPPAFGAGLYRLTVLPDAGPPVVPVEWTLVANIDAATTAMERIAILRTASTGAVELPDNVTPASLRTLLETERTFNLTVAERDNTDSDMGTVYAFRENDIWIDSTDGRASVYTDSQWLQIAGKERVGGSDFDLGTFTAPINIDLPFGTEGHPSLNPAFPLGVVNDNFGTGRDAQWVPGTRTFQVALDAETLTGINFISLTDDPNDDATAVITESRIINVPGGFGLLLTGTLTPEGEAWWNDQTTTGTTVQYLDGLANVYRAAHDGAYLPNPDVIRLDLGGY